MRFARDRFGASRSVRRSVAIGASLAIAGAIAGAYGGLARTDRRTDEALLADAVANLERQADSLAARPGASCTDDFSAFETGLPLRISLFYGYDEHHGTLHDRANAGAMSRILTSRCRGQLSTCGFDVASRSPSAVRLTRTLGGQIVEVNLFTTSLAQDARKEMGLVSAYFGQESRSRAVKDLFYRELVQSDVVFYMGHSRLGGGMGFDDQSGVTTVANTLLRLPLRPVLEALRHRPTNLKVLGMFSCDSNRYFRRAFEEANPALSLILTTGDVDYGPAEQANLGALESVLSKSCGHAFHQAMTSVDESDPAMTYLFRGR